ncbi:MAG: hypothetical protein OEU86_05460, partial [Gammaproteobacteria bacterium]|nr:hypothetical protein [Gammaproteobacteria bacterium]
MTRFIKRFIALLRSWVVFPVACFMMLAWGMPLSVSQDLAQQPETIIASAQPEEKINESSESEPFDAEVDLETKAELPVNSAPEALSRSERIDQFEAQLKNFERTEQDAEVLFEAYRDLTRMRLWQLDMALDAASSINDAALVNSQELEAQHPGFPVQLYALPDNISTVRSLYEDTLDVFKARGRMLGLVSPELRRRAVGAGLYGMQELRSESDLIFLEVRYQILRLPWAIERILIRGTQAPLPLVWFVVQFWLAIFLFRWWRSWIPGTLDRMSSSLLSIRPRTDEILTRLKGLWYIGQIRVPVEWLFLWTVLFGLMEFEGLEFIRDVGLIIVRWSVLTWFAVALLNAFVARGVGGMSGEPAKLRLKSMRLVASWLLLLGLGLDLSNDLVGDAALTAWIWRVFQLLGFPLICALLSIWHMELYIRLERESEPAIARAVYSKQRGLRRWVSSAKVAGLLLASWLRSILIHRIEQFGSVTGASAELVSPSSSVGKGFAGALPPETLKMLLESDKTYIRYARSERQLLVDRINAGASGIVAVVGERGIGKNGLLRQVAEAQNYTTLFIECGGLNAESVVNELGQQVGVDINTASDAELNAAIEARNIRFIAVYDVHLLMRPVMGGLNPISELSELFARITVPLVWGLTVDRYAFQLLARYRADYNLVDNLIQLQPWTEEQIADLIEQRCESAGLKPDFSKIRVPRQYMDTAHASVQDRNRTGLYTMLSALSRGNPAIAIRLFADCISVTEGREITVNLPQSLDDRVFKDTSINQLLVLRVIAQMEQVTYDDIASNLRMDPSVVKTALQFALLRGWIEEQDGKY